MILAIACKANLQGFYQTVNKINNGASSAFPETSAFLCVPGRDFFNAIDIPLCFI